MLYKNINAFDKICSFYIKSIVGDLLKVKCFSFMLKPLFVSSCDCFVISSWAVFIFILSFVIKSRISIIKIASLIGYFFKSGNILLILLDYFNWTICLAVFTSDSFAWIYLFRWAIISFIFFNLQINEYF